MTTIGWGTITPASAGQEEVGATIVVRRGTRELRVPLAKATRVEAPDLWAAVLAHRELNSEPRTSFIRRPTIVLEVESKPFSLLSGHRVRGDDGEEEGRHTPAEELW